MFQEVRSKFDLYADTAAQIFTQAINNQKAGPAAGFAAAAVWYADLAGALGIVSGLLSAVGAGVMIWVTVSRWLADRKIKKLVIRQKKLEIESLEESIKKRRGGK